MLPPDPQGGTVLTSGANWRFGGARRRLAVTSAVTVGLFAGVLASGVGIGAGVAGAADKATGSAVTIGFISDAGGSGAIGTGPLTEQGAKAATEYWNADLGGLEGHKVNLYICENQSTPAGGQTCANDMVQHHVVAVVEPFTGQGQTEVPTIVGAGIPYIVVTGASTAELETPGAYALEGGFPAYLGAMALSAKAHNLKKVAFLVENVPAAIQGAQALGGIVYKAAGIDLQIVPVNPGTADVTPQLQTAVSGGADAVGVIGDVTLCSSFLKGYETLGLKLPRYVLSTCQDPSIEKSATLDKTLAGSYITTTTKTSKADQREYAAIVKAFLPKVSPNANVSSNQSDGVTPVLALANIMKGSMQPATAAGIKAQVATAKNVVIPLSGGLTFTCNGTAIPLLKSVCSSSAAIGTIQAGKSGNVTSVKVYNPTPLF
jgi:branched-chain amino acid transport system substrate-binding protein